MHRWLDGIREVSGIPYGNCSDVSVLDGVTRSKVVARFDDCARPSCGGIAENLHYPVLQALTFVGTMCVEEDPAVVRWVENVIERILPSNRIQGCSPFPAPISSE